MDHLPHPFEPYLPLKVPYYGFRFPYSGPFDDFPRRHNCSLSTGLRPRLEGPSPLHVVSVAQSWLFFGLLEEFSHFFEMDLNIDDFLCDSEGHCAEEPDGLEQNWADDEVISPHHQPETRTQAPRHYWKGICTAATLREDLDIRQSTFITTKRLWWYLHTAIQNLQGAYATDEQKALTRNQFDDFERKLLLAGSVISGINDIDTTGLEHHQMDACVAIDVSLRSLCETLREAWIVSEGETKLEVNFYSRHIYNWMLRRGQCPYHVSWVMNYFSAQSAYYISLLWTPRSPVVQGPSGSHIKTHAECSPAKCCFLQVNENDYMVKHQPECDGCRMLAPDIGEVSRILGGGGIPVIRIRTLWKHRSSMGGSAQGLALCVQDSINMDVIPYQEGLDFCAISHVWSDGLGNPYANALPHCQVRALSSAAISAQQELFMADDLHIEEFPKEAEIFIWIDTLCIPLIKEPRKQAIQRLKDSFALASRVIVLDADLIASEKQSRSRLELGYRILSCNWQRRMWTLQEAVFARKLAFKFADGLVLFEDLNLQEMGGHTNSVYMDLRMKLDYFCSGKYRAETLRNINQTARINRLQSTVTNISHRTTSKLTDESICLATLLDADLRILLETPETQRMRYILDHQKGFSASIIFINGPKIQEVPYRWAPSTFLYPRWHRMQQMVGFSIYPVAGLVKGPTTLAATMTPSGLIIDLPGFFICSPEDISNSEFLAIDDSTTPNRLLLIRTLCEDGGFSGSARPVITFRTTGPTATRNAKTALETPGEGTKQELIPSYAILLMASLDAPMPGYRHLRPRNILGLVISDIEQTTVRSVNPESQATVITGRCEARVDVRDLKQDPEKIKQYVEEITDAEGKVTHGVIRSTVLRCTMAPGVPKWCIR